MTRSQLLTEIARAARRLGAEPQVVSLIGSWASGQNDHAVLSGLRAWNDARHPGLQRGDNVVIEAAVQNEIYQVLYSLGACPELLGPIGSWGDTYDDDAALADLHRFNRFGSIFDH